ncbi:hypothetical protein SLA2020_004860 [Shorea laevis]
MESITLEELHTFHAIDRDIFSRLLLTFQRDIAESLLVMATWLWLEEKGYPNIIVKMARLPDPLVDALADEAALCLSVLGSTNPSIPPNGGLPLHTRVMENNITLHFVLQNKFTAISGIKNFLNTICARIFTDILQRVLGSPSLVTPNNPLNVPGFPHPLFGSVTIMPRAISNDFPAGGLWGWHPSNNITEDDRTMFLTFSRGFPVTEDEVKELFIRMHGECVESVHMQENVPSNEQPLYARLVLLSVTNVDQILCGRRIAKFRINGKHIWARKYERRE